MTEVAKPVVEQALLDEGSAIAAVQSIGADKDTLMREIVSVAKAMALTVPDGNHYLCRVPEIEVNLDKALNEGADVISRTYGANVVIDFISVLFGLEGVLDRTKQESTTAQGQGALQAWIDTIVSRNYVMHMDEEQAEAFKELFAGRGVLLTAPDEHNEAGEKVIVFVLSRLAANLFRVHQAGRMTDDDLKAITFPKVFEDVNLPAGYSLI